MTTKDYQPTIDRIYELVPRLKELSFAQIYKNGNKRYRVLRVGEENALGGQVVLEMLDVPYGIAEEPADILLTEYECCGFPITLEAVLEAIWQSGGLAYCVVGDGLIKKYGESGDQCQWQYHKPFQDQSEECKNFITQILLP